MAVTIVVEDGTIVADANSYISVADARAYAEQRGVTLPVSDDEVGAMIINSTDYIESFECKFAGERVSTEQELSWPRADAYLCGSDTPFPSDQIPKDLKKAQCASVIALSQGLVLMPNITAQDYVTEETVGPITTKYANPIQTGIETKFTGIESLLERLYPDCGCNGGLAIRTVRV